MFDLDRYYTPDDVADQLIEEVAPSGMSCCADSACGEGSLLLAARRVFDEVACVGVDKDRSAIRRLRRRYPDWRLSVADVLDPATCRRARVFEAGLNCDLLALNPPFSMNGRRRVSVMFRGTQLHSSVAMGHVLRSVELFAPKDGAVAVVPESLLFSDVDEAARQELARTFRLNTIAELRNTTFRGARANAVVVRLVPTSRRMSAVAARSMPTVRGLQVVRGGLPTFAAKPRRAGVPFVHSTDIGMLVKSRSTASCKRVEAIGRGVICGPVILLPRVGMPNRDATKAVYLRSRVQLSDCVIALRFSSMRAADAFSENLHARWQRFLGNYRGTGARYVTVARLHRWLARNCRTG